MVIKKKINLFPHESFPYRLELKDRTAWFQCQEHMDKEILRYQLKPRDYKASCKRGHKIVRPDKPKPKRRKKEVVKPKIETKRKDLLAPTMKFKLIQFDKKSNLLNPKLNT